MKKRKKKKKQGPLFHSPFARKPLKNKVARGEKAPAPSSDPLGILPHIARLETLKKKRKKSRKKKAG